MSAILQAVTDREFDRVVGGTTVPVLVAFWKLGCGHCQVLMRELEQLQTECSDQVRILTMNVEENFQIPAEVEISSLPALALYRYGEFQRFIGGLGKRNEIAKQMEIVLGS